MKMKSIIKLMSISLILLFSSIISSGYIQNNSIDFENWERINDDGFGNPENMGVRGIEIFEDKVVIGTASFTGDLPYDTPLPLKKFYYEYFVNRSAVDNFKSNGCEIWVYNNTDFSPIIAENGIMERGFGNKNNSEIGFLIKYQDCLYAGTRNYHQGCQIWRTDKLNSSWECIIDDGFGNVNNSWLMEAHIFKGDLFVGTFNINEGTEVFRTNDGENFTQVVGNQSKIKNGFDNPANFYTWSMCEYDDELYIGTNNKDYGGELWRSSDGENWTAIISDAEGALYPLDFTKFAGYHGGIRNMVLYDNELYLGFITEDTPLNVHFKGIGKILSLPIAIPSILNIYRRWKTSGLEIWKYNSTTDDLTMVVGGRNNGNFSGGFGDPCNEYPWAMIVYNNSIYVGTSHPDSYDITIERMGFLKYGLTIQAPKGGCELWKLNKTSCEQINQNGFGNDYNVGIRELIVYQDKLLSGVFNVKTGCEIWEIQLE